MGFGWRVATSLALTDLLLQIFQTDDNNETTDEDEDPENPTDEE